MADEGGGYEENYGNDAADFVDFSGDLKKLLKNSAADMEIDHWLSQDAVESMNEAIKAFVSEMCSGSLTVLEQGKKKGKVLNPGHIVEVGADAFSQHNTTLLLILTCSHYFL